MPTIGEEVADRLADLEGFSKQLARERGLVLNDGGDIRQEASVSVLRKLKREPDFEQKLWDMDAEARRSYLRRAMRFAVKQLRRKELHDRMGRLPPEDLLPGRGGDFSRADEQGIWTADAAQRLIEKLLAECGRKGRFALMNFLHKRSPGEAAPLIERSARSARRWHSVGTGELARTIKRVLLAKVEQDGLLDFLKVLPDL